MQDTKLVFDEYDLYLIEDWKNQGNVAPDLAENLSDCRRDKQTEQSVQVIFS